MNGRVGGRKEVRRYFTLQLLDERHGHPGALSVKHHLALRHRQEPFDFLSPAITTRSFLERMICPHLKDFLLWPEVEL